MARRKMHAVPHVKNIHIESGFWGFYRKLVKNAVIPYQWKAFNDEIPEAEPSHCVNNFRMAARKNAGEIIAPDSFQGFVFQDSDLAKWLEAAAYELAIEEDPGLARIVDEIVELVGQAQEPDGYLDTYYTVVHPNEKWTNLKDNHELYCAGHMLEAAVALYECTGRKKLLEIMERNMTCIASVLGPEQDKKRGYPGHPELELALMRMYHTTGEERYLEMAAWFVDERGQVPLYFDKESEKRQVRRHWHDDVIRPSLAYFQADKPVRDQTEIRGHAVRALYLLAGMVDVAKARDDHALMETAQRWWDSTVSRQMYITGGVGSTHHGEAFSFPFHLPNDTVYAETCASIALIFVAQRLLRHSPKSAVADVMERALYNTCIGSMQRDGTKFLYVNPLEVWPEASKQDCDHWHVTPERQAWFGCACCPPNLARLITSLGQYVYSMSEDTVWLHLFVENKAKIEVAGGLMTLDVRTQYPYDGTLTVCKDGSAGKLAMRIPGWCRNWILTVDGKRSDATLMENGYLFVTVDEGAMELSLKLDMPAERIRCSTEVPENIGKMAVTRGPLVYCIEGADNGEKLWQCALPMDSELVVSWENELLDGMAVITANGVRLRKEAPVIQTEPVDLYTVAGNVIRTPHKLRFIPYHAWSNRGVGEMRVWLPEL